MGCAMELEAIAQVFVRTIGLKHVVFTMNAKCTFAVRGVRVEAQFIKQVATDFF